MSFESLRDLGSVSPWLPPLGLARRRTGWPRAWGEAAARPCRCSGKVRNLPPSGQRRCSHPRAVSNPRPRRRGSGAALGQAVGAAVGTPPMRPHCFTSPLRQQKVFHWRLWKSSKMCVRCTASSWCERWASPSRMRPIPVCVEAPGAVEVLGSPRGGLGPWLPGASAAPACCFPAPPCPLGPPDPTEIPTQLGNRISHPGAGGGKSSLLGCSTPKSL